MFKELVMRKTSLSQVYELAKKDKRVLFIGSDLGPDVLLEMKEEMPKNLYKNKCDKVFPNTPPKLLISSVSLPILSWSIFPLSI